MDEFLRALTGGATRPQGAGNEPPLGNLLAGLLGGERETGSDNPLAAALAALLGGGSGGGGNDVAGLAEQVQVSPAIVQAVIALLVGQMGRPGTTKSGGTDLAALLDQASGGEIDEAALKSSGLPQELTKTTGLDLSNALRVLQKLLPALAKLLNLPGATPAAAAKPKPKPATKPKPAASATSARPKPTAATAAKPKPAAATAAKPKPAASTAAKPKPATSTAAKPKPAASTAAKPKPAASTAAKPKPATSTAAKPKPAAKPRPRKSDGALEINLDAPTTDDQ